MFDELAGDASAHEVAPADHLLGPNSWVGDLMYVIQFLWIEFVEAVIYVLKPGKETSLDFSNHDGGGIEGYEEGVELGPPFLAVGAHALVRTF